MAGRKKEQAPEKPTSQVNVKGVPVEVLDKLRAIAFIEGVDYQELYNLAFVKIIEAYEKKNGPIEVRPKGDGLKKLKGL